MDYCSSLSRAQTDLLNLSTGMLSAAASLGLSLLWDTDVGLSHVDKYTYSSEEHIKVSRTSGMWCAWLISFRLEPFLQRVF